jgi:hypothetical protein
MRLRKATFLYLILAVGCGPADPGGKGPIIPQLTMDGVQFEVDREGVTTASGDAERLTYRRDTTDLTAFELAMDLVTSTGVVRVTAPAGSGHLRDQRFRVSGGVRATRGGDVATTPSATSSPDPAGRLQIRGEEAVEVVGAGYRLTGTGFDVDPGTGDLSIHGQPRLLTGLGHRP